MNRLKKLIANNWILIITVLLGAALRFWGITYDYPLTNSIGDEPHLISGALRMLNDKSILIDTASIRYFPLMYYINIIGAMIFSALLFIFGGVSSLAGLKEHVILNLGDWIILSRVITALFGTFSIVLLYLISQKLFNKQNISYLAAIFLAISPYHVSLSHIAKAWTPLTFFLLLSLWYFLRTWGSGSVASKRKLFYSSIFIIVSVGSNLFGVLAYPLFLIVVFVYYCQGKFKNFYKFLFSRLSIFFHILLLVELSILAFLARGAFALVFKSFKIFVMGDPELLQPEIHGRLFWEGSLLFKIGTTFNFLMQFETIIFLLLIPAFWYLFKKNKTVFSFLSLSFLLFFLPTNPPVLSITRPRYFSFVLPFMFLPVAYLLHEILVQLKKKNIVLAIIFFIIAFSPATFISARDDYLSQKNSTNLLLFNWIKDNLVAGENIMVNGFYLIQDFVPDKKLLSNIKEFSPEFYSSRMKYIENELVSEQQGYGVYSGSYYCRWPKNVRAEIHFQYLALAWSQDYNKPASGFFEVCPDEFINLDQANLILDIDTSPIYEFNIGNDIETESYRPLTQMKQKGPSLRIYKTN